MSKQHYSSIANTKTSTVAHQAATVPQPLTVSSVRPTKKQRELLGYIEQFIAEHGYSPSYREIMNGLKYNSVATVAVHVGNLIKRGHLVKRDHSARSLEVVSPSRVAKTPFLTNEVSVSEEKWLVERVEKLFSDAAPTDGQLRDIRTVIDALHILGLEGAAQTFMVRFKELTAELNR